MPITGADPALMYSLSGLMRSGASRSDYYTPAAAITIGGVDYRDHVIKGSVRITDVLDETPNTCSLIVRGDSTFIPTKGQEIIIGLGNITNRLFAGHVLNVEQRRRKTNQRYPRYTVNCVDYSWQFDWKRVEGVYYASTSATTILGNLVSSFAPDFTTSIEASLPSIEFQSNNEELLSTAFARACKRVGARYYIDYDRVVHAFVTPESDNLPEDLDSDNTGFWGLLYSDDISQVRTRVKVIGGGSATTAVVAVGATTIPVDDTRLFASGGGTVLVGANKCTYTGKSVASGPGNLTGVPASSTGSVLVAIAQGESVRVLRVAQDSTAATALATLVGDGDGYVEHVIEDGAAGDAAAGQEAAADLAANKDCDYRISFQSRDKFLRAGKAIVVNLTNAATGQVIDEEFQIQQVVIDNISMAIHAFPLRTVEAGKTRVDLFNVLQQVAGE
jgi:hypothetical protein